jgi:nanoRNase/pAp phosphatase (c-di-AMP/oligoRNAs hydrolase)
MQKTPKRQALGLLKQSQEILIVGPQRWDADAAAGVLALNTMLKKCGKTTVAVAPDKMPRKLHFLPNADAVSQTLGSGNDFVISISTKSAKIKNLNATEHDDVVDLVLETEGLLDPSDLTFRRHTERFDAIVTIGADAPEDCGKIYAEHTELFAQTPILNISVSPANELFGRVNLVDASASSVSELLADLFEAEEDWKKLVDKELSTVLLSGLLEATDSFLAPNTSARSLELAASLQENGANQSDVIEHLFKQKSFSNLRVLGRLLGNLQMDATHQIAWTNLTASDFELTETSFDDLDGWSDQLLRHINDTDLVVAFIEKGDDSIVQFRAKNEFDLSSIEEEFVGKIEKMNHGFDLLIDSKSVPEIQSHVLRIVADWQERRLKLEKTDIKKVSLSEVPVLEQPKQPSPKKSTPMAKAPENIPFEIPIRPGEKGADVNLGKK